MNNQYLISLLLFFHFAFLFSTSVLGKSAYNVCNGSVFEIQVQGLIGEKFTQKTKIYAMVADKKKLVKVLNNQMNLEQALIQSCANGGKMSQLAHIAFFL